MRDFKFSRAWMKPWVYAILRNETDQISEYHQCKVSINDILSYSRIVFT